MRHVDRQYSHELRAALDLMLGIADDEIGSVPSIAKAAKLGTQTIYNLRSGKTRTPVHYTLVKLARATGCHFECIRGVVRLRSRKAS